MLIGLSLLVGNVRVKLTSTSDDFHYPNMYPQKYHILCIDSQRENYDVLSLS